MEDVRNFNQAFRERGYPQIGRELFSDEVSELRIGSAFYVVRNSSAPLLSMMMGITDNSLVKVAQLSAGRVAFALNSIGGKTRCYQALM